MGILHLSREEIKEATSKGKVTISVYGLGHVGLPLCVCFLRAGAKVIGVDVDADVVSKLNEGISPLAEPGVEEAVKRFLGLKRFKATSALADAAVEADVDIVCVPTLVSRNKEVDLSRLVKAVEAIGEGLKKNDVVIVESSVPPLTTSEVVKPILEEKSKLVAEKDFGLAHSPERVMEGRVIKDIEENYPKIVGGIGPRSAETASALYECVARKGIVRVSDATTAEASKLFEGVYRDVNIALANELAKLSERLGIDFMEAREAALTQPYCHLHVPGIGVGGMCIPFYPYFLMSVAERKGMDLSLVRVAREINEAMPRYAVSEALKPFKKRERFKIAVLGLAFRGNIGDTRNSPVFDLLKELKKRNVDVTVFDPYVEGDNKLREMGVKLSRTMDEAVNNASLVIVATDHREFRELDLNRIMRKTEEHLFVYDGRCFLKPLENLNDSKMKMYGIGRPLKTKTKL